MSSIAMCGCSAIGNALYPDDKNSLSGAGTIVVGTSDDQVSTSTQEDMEVIDLPKLLNAYGPDKPQTIATELTAHAEPLRFQRNDMQNRIIAASNQRCETYVRALIDSRAETLMNWTGLTALLSGAATVVSPAAIAKALSEGATTSTGIIGADNQAYFNNQIHRRIRCASQQRAQAIHPYQECLPRDILQKVIRANGGF